MSILNFLSESPVLLSAMLEKPTESPQRPSDGTSPKSHTTTKAPLRKASTSDPVKPKTANKRKVSGNKAKRRVKKAERRAKRKEAFKTVSDTSIETKVKSPSKGKTKVIQSQVIKAGNKQLT